MMVNDDNYERKPEVDFVPIDQHFEEYLNSTKNPTERRSLLELTRSLTRLPIEKSAAALEAGASIAGISLRAAIEFLRAAPAAAETLEAAELRSWGELGRRLAMGEVETSISFFVAGVDPLKDLTSEVRQLIFQLCLRQITLSAVVAHETFQKAPEITKAIGSNQLSASVLSIAAEISRRSARHSAEFLQATPAVLDSLKIFRQRKAVTEKALNLANDFAARAGGIAADAWATLSNAVTGLKSPDAIRLLDGTGEFLERGGGVALQVLLSGSEFLRTLPEVFDEWIELLKQVAENGNASLIAFVRSSPRFVRSISGQADHSQAVAISSRVVELTREIAKVDGEAALACFRSSASALRSVSIDQFEEWVRRGLELNHNDVRARRSYFAIETRRSHETLHTGGNGLPLDSVQHLLLLYIEGLTGRNIEIAPLAAVPLESRIGDGRTIYLPSLVAEFGDDELDFRLYKVLAAHAAGQIEFGTYDRDTTELQAAYQAIRELYDPRTADALDAFSLPDEFVSGTRGTGGGTGVPPVGGSATHAQDAHATPPTVDYRAVLKLFPISHLARRIFGTLENVRVDRRLRLTYRGLARDLDLIREYIRRSRPRILDLPATMAPFELLFQVTLGGGARDDARQYYGQIVS